MKVRAFVFDFDGTIAPDQQPLRSRELISLLHELADAGVELIMLTGRDVDYTLGPTGIMDRSLYRRMTIIGEGGSVVFHPATDTVEELAPHRSHELISFIRKLKVPVTEVWADHCAVMTLSKHAPAIEKAIRLLNRARRRNGEPPLQLDTIINGGSATFLPPGIDKEWALEHYVGQRLGIPAGEILGAGDGGNDGGWLARCGVAIVPANGIPELKRLPNAITPAGNDAQALIPVLRQLLRNNLRIDPPQRGLAVA